MKNSYMNALTYGLVKDEDFLPVRDRMGNHALYPHRHVLQLKNRNNVTIAEVIDGDVMTAAEIEKHCRKNTEWIRKASAVSRPKVIDIYVFDRYPDIVKEEAISRSAGKDYCLIITDVASRQVICMNGPGEESTYVAHAKKAHEQDPELHKDLGMVMEVIKSYNEEIVREMLPHKMKATYVLIGITAAIFILDYILKYFTGEEIIKDLGVKQSILITVGEYWRLVTPMFLHADIMHLGSNMLSLYIIGQTIEKFFGAGKFAAIYLIGGIMGNVFSYTLTQNVSLGASGAVFAVGGAVIVIWKMKASRLLRMTGRDLFLVILICLNIVLGFGNSGIDNWAHLGGLIGGILLSLGFGYRNDRLKKQHKMFSFAMFIILAAVVFYIGYDKWMGFISSYIQ